MDRNTGGQEKQLLSGVSLTQAVKYSDLVVYVIDRHLQVLASSVHQAQSHRAGMTKNGLRDADLEKICLSLIKEDLKQSYGKVFETYRTHKIEHLIKGKIYNLHLEATFIPLKDREGKVNQVVVFVQDIGETKNLEEKLRRLALTDPLTNLYNRQYFDKKLEEELRRAHRYQTDLSVIIIDLNNLKYVNDHLGHEQGDHLLKTVAGILKDNVREVDIVSRCGGDEMAIILPETNGKQAESGVKRIRKAVKEWNQKNRGPELSLSLSIGWASNSESSEMTLVTRADKMMYEDKKKYYARQAEVGKSNLGSIYSKS